MQENKKLLGGLLCSVGVFLFLQLAIPCPKKTKIKLVKKKSYNVVNSLKGYRLDGTWIDSTHNFNSKLDNTFENNQGNLGLLITAFSRFINNMFH